MVWTNTHYSYWPNFRLVHSLCVALTHCDRRDLELAGISPEWVCVKAAYLLTGLKARIRRGVGPELASWVVSSNEMDVTGGAELALRPAVQCPTHHQSIAIFIYI